MPALSAVCLIAKNEAPYLLEWVAYYKVLGFDQIIIYENNSTDESADILSALARSKEIILRTWSLGKNESPQLTAYADAISRVAADWLLFVDADEFLVLKEHSKVNDFLKPFQARREVGLIGVNWRLFGDSGLILKDDRLVIERFTQAGEESFQPHTHLKSFIRTKLVIRTAISIHACGTTGVNVHPSGRKLRMSQTLGISEEIEMSHAQVNHYYTKTPEEYAIKAKRGQGGAGDNTPDLKYWYNEGSYQIHNRNDEEDLSITKLLAPVKEEVLRLKKIYDKHLADNARAKI